MSRTVTDVYGREIADRLAALAIDLACDAPETIATLDTKVKKRLVEETRGVLEEAGIDWRNLVRSRIEREQEARERVHAMRARSSDGS